LTIDCVVGNTQTFENNQQQNKLIDIKEERMVDHGNEECFYNLYNSIRQMIDQKIATSLE
jgi:hypothetical protein